MIPIVIMLPNLICLFPARLYKWIKFQRSFTSAGLWFIGLRRSLASGDALTHGFHILSVIRASKGPIFASIPDSKASILLSKPSTRIPPSDRFWGSSRAMSLTEGNSTATKASLNAVRIPSVCISSKPTSRRAWENLSASMRQRS